MRKTTSWVWVAVACTGVAGTGAVFAFGPDAKPLPRVEPPPPNKKPADEEWIPKPDPDGKVVGGGKVPTAFPELAMPELDPKEPREGFQKRREEQFAKLCPRFAGKTIIKIEPTDDTLRKLLKARLNQGLAQMIRTLEVIRIGSWSSQFFAETIDCLVDMEATCLELWGGQPKELIPWLEELVVVAKEFERFQMNYVLSGTTPPQRGPAATRHRLRAEATLWKAKKAG